VQCFEWGNLRERDTFQDLGVDEDNTKMHLQKAGRGKDWINLAKDRDSGGLL